jgi:hypothetical protein
MEDGMEYSTSVIDVKSVQNIGWKTWREGITWMILDVVVIIIIISSFYSSVEHRTRVKFRHLIPFAAKAFTSAQLFSLVLIHLALSVAISF